MLPSFSIRVTVNYEQVVSLIPRDAVVARIYSDAVGLNGFPYFWAVELGRRAMAAPTAAGKKALRWIGAPGTIASFPEERFRNSVFAKAVAATRSLSMRRRTLAQALSVASGWEKDYNATRDSMVALVNRVAVLLTWLLAQNTPKRSESLSKSYRIVPAE